MQKRTTGRTQTGFAAIRTKPMWYALYPLSHWGAHDSTLKSCLRKVSVALLNRWQQSPPWASLSKMPRHLTFRLMTE